MKKYQRLALIRILKGIKGRVDRNLKVEKVNVFNTGFVVDTRKLKVSGLNVLINYHEKQLEMKRK